MRCDVRRLSKGEEQHMWLWKGSEPGDFEAVRERRGRRGRKEGGRRKERSPLLSPSPLSLLSPSPSPSSSLNSLRLNPYCHNLHSVTIYKFIHMVYRRWKKSWEEEGRKARLCPPSLSSLSLSLSLPLFLSSSLPLFYSLRFIPRYYIM